MADENDIDAQDEAREWLFDKLNVLAQEYIDDASTCASTEPETGVQWGLEILVADLFQIVREKGKSWDEVETGGLLVHTQRTDEDIYDSRPKQFVGEAEHIVQSWQKRKPK